MYIRQTKTTHKKTGKVYTYYKLVESVSTSTGSRQRVVMHLGVLNLSPEDLPVLASLLECALSGQQSLFGSNPLTEIAARLISDYRLAHQVVGVARKTPRNLTPVDLSSIESTDTRVLGPALVGHTFFQRMQFSRILTECGFTPPEVAAAEAAIVGRLVAPGSEESIYRWYRDQSALQELMTSAIVPRNNLYSVADRLLDKLTQIETLLRDRERTLFSLAQTVLLYDLTNTYFEGSASKVSGAKGL